MTTATTNTPIDHTTDAGFRAWGSELSGMLATVGLVQTADTGQINWTTVLRPATNTAAGYEIWAWSDSLQSTAPVVMKIEYGTSVGSTTPRIWLTVGTGSDGAGTITGAQTDRAALSPTSLSAPGTASYPNYVCHTDGFFGLIHKGGGSTSSGGRTLNGAFVSRPLGADGAPSAEGVAVVVPGVGSVNSASVSASVAFGTGQQYPSSGTGWLRDFAMVPMRASASLVGTDYQVVRNVGAFPRFRTHAGCLSYLRSEIAQGTAIDVALEGSTSRTYLCLGTYALYATNQDVDGYSHAMMWE